MNWYKIAQEKTVIDQGPGKISPEDLAKLYYYEKEYSELFIKKQSGQHLTDEEYKKFHIIKPKLENLAHDLGNQFYEIAGLIMTVNDSYYGDFTCPNCWTLMEEEDSNENDWNQDIICPNCEFSTKEDDWQDFWGVEHTDYGGGYLRQFQNMWDKAFTLSEQLIALHYIINAVHGSGRLIHLFMDKSGGLWTDEMKNFLNALSTGDIPIVRRERGMPFWDFQLDYGEFAPDFKETM